MKQFFTILKFELKNYYKSKSFVGVTLFLILALAVVMFFPRIKDAFIEDNNDDAEAVEASAEMFVIADDMDVAEMYATVFAESFPDYIVTPTAEGVDSVKGKITDGSVECAFLIESPTKYKYLVNNLSMYDENTYVADEVMKSVFQMNSMLSGGLSTEEATAVLSTPIESETESLGVDQMQNFFYAYIMIFALYMVIFLYGQMVTMNVATEKSSRAMELLITSAKPESMMFGKVFAACISGFAQLALVFGSALAFYNINRDYWSDFEFADMFFDIPPYLLVYMLVFFVLGFLVYAFLFGAVGSTVSKLEEVNTAVTPLMYMFIFSFFVPMFSMGSGNIDGILMKVCSFIPFTSSMAMFTRIALSVVPTYEIVISIAILVVSVFGIGWLSAKIYRVGVLLYGTPPKPKAIFEAMRKA